MMYLRAALSLLLFAGLAAPAAFADSAEAPLPEAPIASVLGPESAELSIDCDEPASSTVPEANPEDLSKSLDATGGAHDTAVCEPQFRTIYSCTCWSGTRFRKLNQERECCGVSCTGWWTTSSSCTQYTC